MYNLLKSWISVIVIIVFYLNRHIVIAILDLIKVAMARTDNVGAKKFTVVCISDLRIVLVLTAILQLIWIKVLSE